MFISGREQRIVCGKKLTFMVNAGVVGRVSVRVRDGLAAWG